MPTFGSLFAGIGGIDLGLERAGWTGRWQVEWDEYCQHVLAHHWPDLPRYGDITTVDWSTVEPVDLLAGGFPCQPVSFAGKGLAQDDARWLWPEFRRAIRDLRPNYVLVENVPGLLRRGLHHVFGDLAALGYDAEWDCVPAAAVGAPHTRDRVWIVAYAQRWELGQLADADRQRLGQSARGGEPVRTELGRSASHREATWGSRTWAGRRFFEPGLGRNADGVPGGLDVRWPAPPGPIQYDWEPPRIGRGHVDGAARLKALGNAVVPQVVEVIGRRLLSVIEAERAA